jgi:hypothetical protein
MSDIPTKTYPPEFLEAMIVDHEAQQAGATTEDSSAVQKKGDAMSEDLVNLAQRWPERAATHYEGCEADHTGCLLKKLAREVERLATERDEARAEVERLRANGQALLDTSRPTDEDIWREAFITMLPSYPWEKAAEQSDCVLVEYRKRWPR